MQQTFVLTVMADDRPGIVEQLSHIISDHQGNWLDSSMARLAGKFAGIVHIEVPGGQQSALSDALNRLSDNHIQVSLAASGEEPNPSGDTLCLSIVGNDRPGIVRDIAQVVARNGANIEQLDTCFESAPMTGEPLFKAICQVQVKQSQDIDTLCRELEAMTDELMVDISNPS